MRKHSIKNRIISALSVAALLMQTWVAVPTSFAAPSEAEYPDGVLHFDNADIPYTATLRDTGSRTYEYTLVLNPQFSLEDGSKNRTVAQTGTFVVPVTGDYLLEAWGGKGGNGMFSYDYPYYAGGDGGSGGYVYGSVHLTKGDVLTYSAGGNGATVVYGGSRAANGGGGNGFPSLSAVGGGGGYTAIYNNGELLMVAGGGGGGGVGSNHYVGARHSSTGPQGGAGGSAEGAGISVSGGTVYPGENGYSSGLETGNVGIGGTDVPGVQGNGTWNGYSGSVFETGGNGGYGNLYGGAGGAGYTGGSGGTMNGPNSPYQIGGGGGGSSFASDDVSAALTSAQKALLEGSNPSSTGGAVCIQLADLGTDLDYLNNLTVSAGASAYMQITGVTVDNTAATATYSPESLSITGVSAFSPVTITVTLSAKDGFAGGNDVPMFTDDVLSVIASGNHGTPQVNACNATGYANVPYAFTAIGNNCEYDATQASPTPVPGTDLYTEDAVYTAAKAAASADHPFIASVSDYMVNDGVPAASYAPDFSTNYKVSFVVTPQRPNASATGAIATVGERLTEKEFSAAASIKVKSDHTVDLNSNEMTYEKTLTYDPVTGLYDLTFDFTSLVKKPVSSGAYEPMSRSATDYSSDGTFVVPETGYYLIQAWGGKGGDGGIATAIVSLGILGTRTYTGAGGQGADGGYSYMLVELCSGDTLTISCGATGVAGNTDSTQTGHALASGGSGGRASSVQKSGDILVIGGGGGGGGGGYATVLSATSKGENGNTQTRSDSCDGAPGTAATEIWTLKYAEGTGGLSGYSSPSNPPTQNDYSFLSSTSRSLIQGAASQSSQYGTQTSPNGHVTITPLDKPGLDAVDVQPYDLFSAEISPYFTIESAETGGLTSNGTPSIANPEGNNTHTVTVANLVPSSAISADGTEAQVNFSVTLHLKPMEGFLGGNDVPLLLSSSLYQEDSDSNSGNNTVAIAAQNDTDYANVAIPDCFELTATDADYVIGGTPVSESDMVSYTPASGSTLQTAFVIIDSDYTVSPTFDGEPRTDTEYTFTASVVPSTAIPEKATQGPLAEELTKTANGTICVYASMLHDFTYVTAEDNCFSLTPEPLGEDYITVLTADSGYVLSSAISITRDGEALSEGTDFTYDSGTGVVVIFGSAMTGAMEITATADKVIEKFKLHYYYQTDPANPDAFAEAIDEYEAGAEIVDSTSVLEDSLDAFPGYTYKWDAVPDTMPANDYWIFGRFESIPYAVEISYVYAGGDGDPHAANEQAASPELIEDLCYGDSYSSTSPQIDGYTASRPVVSGVVDSAAIAGTLESRVIDGTSVFIIPITVTYTKNPEGQVQVLFLYTDTNLEARAPITGKYEAGQQYVVSSAIPDGYYIKPGDLSSTVVTSGSIVVISGTMTASDVAYGVTITVKYSPKEPWVSFMDSLYHHEFDRIQVTYQDAYGENGPLPVPVEPGKEFTGWYLEPTLVHQVTGADIVEIWEDHTLYAGWEDALPVNGELTVIRSGSINEGAGTRTFVYLITNTDTGDTVTVTVTGDSSVTVVGLPVGPYTVKQCNDWSCRFADAEQTVELKTATGTSVTFDGAAQKDKWLNASSEAIVNRKS